MIREIVHYRMANGRQPFIEWLFALNDKRIRNRILSRLDRLSAGNFGDSRLVGTGIWELRFHFGPGYRVYFALDGDTFVLLLCGGDKSTQAKDICLAEIYRKDYLRRR